MRLSIVFAILAAVLNAVSNLLQRTADRREPQQLELHFSLLWDLAHKPIWLAGIAASTCSFLLMAVALRYGPLALVQPLIVLELPLTLVGAGAVFHVRLHAREWAATALLAAGLAALVGFLAPRAGAPHAPWAVWALGVGASGALAAVLVVVALGTQEGRRAALFGAAAGILFGLSAALMKGMTWRFPDGPLGVLSAWQTYAMIVSGVLAFLVFQSALMAGDLVAAQPGVSLLDPCTALLWAVFAFREPINGGIHMVLAIAGGLLMGAGAVLIARSPLLAGARDPVPVADPGGGG